MNNKIFHLAASLVVFAIPLVVGIHAGWLDLTIGGVLNAIYLAASQYLKPTAPTV